MAESLGSRIFHRTAAGRLRIRVVTFPLYLRLSLWSEGINDLSDYLSVFFTFDELMFFGHFYERGF